MRTTLNIPSFDGSGMACEGNKYKLGRGGKCVRRKLINPRSLTIKKYSDWIRDLYSFFFLLNDQSYLLNVRKTGSGL